MKFYAQFVQQLELFKHRNYHYVMINWKALLSYADHFPLLPNLISITINNPHWCRSITHAQLPGC
ncbi:hypothetical protein FRC08_009796 [Ceratobasidium sp. 394]|nr:hypothetical protein FRC08_009796 [Ceratobasidium sp. 394]